MQLPNGERAFVDLRKLTQYCLSPVHPVGKHKARVFRSALGLTAANALTLREVIRFAAATDDARFEDGDEFGQRFSLDFELSTPAGTANIRTAWIVRRGRTSLA